VTVYTASDDYLGDSLTNPTVPEEYRGSVQRGPVRLGKHSIIGAGAVILPGASIGEGTAVGALSLVVAPLKPWIIASGSPARPRGERRRDEIERLEGLMRTRGLVR
jgi:acetyltransferase-like isoleucine patch superfamily enzyme